MIDGDFYIRIVTLTAVIVSLVVLHYSIWIRMTSARRVGLLMFWLIILGIFLVDRVVDDLPGIESPLSPEVVHALSVFIRLQAALSVAAVAIIAVFCRRKEPPNE